ncbi:MAG: NlpC/P60 family protein [Candidatus Hydrothermales bacterium]
MKIYKIWFLFLLFSSQIFSYDIVNCAMDYLGVEYKWGGRLTRKNPGLDCLGLIFLAYSKAYRKSWVLLPVNPSELVKSKKLGIPVEGLNGVLKEEIDTSRLKRGDIIYFLVPYPIGNDKPLAKIEDKDYYAWHLGIYIGNGEVINAYPGDKVRIDKLIDIIGEDGAIFVTRIEQTPSNR